MRGSILARPLLVALVVALATTLVPVTSTAQTVDEGSLEAAKRKVAEVEAQLESARARQRTADVELREADAQLARLEEAVNEAAIAVEQQTLAVEESARRVDELDTEVTHQKEAFSDRAAALYKRGIGASVVAMLSAGSMNEALDRGAFVQALSASDRAALEHLTAARIEVAAERERLLSEREKLEQMQVEQRAMLEKVAQLREQRALEAADARADVHELEQHKEQLDAESKRIEILIKARERAAAADRAGGRGGWTGNVSTSGYQWPRCAAVTSEFGRRWGRRHEGLDLDGSTGDPIYAAKAGVVIFAGWQGGYGRLTLVDHGDGVVTAYAHQSAQVIGYGRSVSKGQLIGRVGSTGHSTGSHLHFETRVHGAPVNPRRFLPNGC